MANPIIYRLVPSPSRYEIRQCRHEENAGIFALHNNFRWMCCYSVTIRTVFDEFSSSFRSFYLFSRRRSHQLIFRNNLRFVYMASEPPAKRTKKEIVERSDNNGGDESILATHMAKRQKVCKSVSDFKFDKKRVRLISSSADMPETCKGIAYWMWREQRVQGKPYRTYLMTGRYKSIISILDQNR